MDWQTNERFLAANRELQEFLQRAKDLPNGTATITAEGIARIWIRLLTLAPEVEDIYRDGRTATDAKDEVGKYVENLRRLRESLEKVRHAMLARRSQLRAAKRHVDGLRGWINAYQQTR